MKTQRRMTSLFLVSMMLQAVMADSSITCFQDNLKCEMVNGNLIETYVGTTWEECKLLCEDEVACLTFNYFGPESSFHPHNACLLFSECESKLPSEDCLLGTREQPCTCTSLKYCPCNIPYEGSMDADNYVDLASEVQSEEACKNLCSSTTDCTVFTYYDSLDPYQPEVCLLLSSSGLEKSATKCEHCKTGPATCRSGQKCQAAFLTDGNTYQHVFAKTNTTASLVSAERDCFLDVRALAIGGGGHGGGSGYRGGAGSGYPEFGVLQLRAYETLNLIVGGDKETSSVEKDGKVLLIAAAGQDVDLYNGGDGYSGGGAGMGGGGDGGSDGSDGGDTSSYTGGKGSGLDVGTLNMTRFVLMPGKAGTHTEGYGGGGGGLLVNGEKPGGNEYWGEGFGGGGGYGGSGFPGCVLIEV